MRVRRVALACLLATTCSAAPAGREPASAHAALAAPPAAGPPPADAASLDAEGTYLRPNARLPGGGIGFVHPSEADMPWRIAVGFPRTPPNFTTLELDEVRLLVAHEFGHVLGLGHCLDCDSAMNYSWHTRERVLVTDTDVRTFAALVARPNGSAAP